MDPDCQRPSQTGLAHNGTRDSAATAEVRGVRFAGVELPTRRRTLVTEEWPVPTAVEGDNGSRRRPHVRATLLAAVGLVLLATAPASAVRPPAAAVPASAAGPVQVSAGASGTVPVQVTAGGGHTCAIQVDSTIVCWGSNNYGQATPPPGTFKAIDAGGLHTCAIRTDETVTCWGKNDNGCLLYTSDAADE